MDTAATRAGDAYKLMVITIFHVLDSMFYGDAPDVIHIQNVGGRRFRVLMDYLLTPTNVIQPPFKDT